MRKNKGSRRGSNKKPEKKNISPKRDYAKEHLGDPIPSMLGGDARLTAMPTGHHIGNGCYVAGRHYF